MNLIDQIKYGNLSKEYSEIISEPDKLSIKLNKLGLYKPLFKISPPSNSSLRTKKELENLVKYTNNISEVVLEFCKRADTNSFDIFLDFLKRHGIYDTTEEDLYSVIRAVEPLMLKLKKHYNRPRPFQLAYYYDLDLHVLNESDTANTPSYPSGHALEAYVMAEKLAEKYPKHSYKLRRLGKLIGLSRLLLGVHYRSDYDFARYVGKLIIKNDLIEPL
jgi:hypothetical protein